METSALGAPHRPPPKRRATRGRDDDASAIGPHRSVDERMAAAPPPTSIFWPVSVSLPSSFLNTWMFFWIMFCTASVLPSLENDAPCDHAPIGASLVLLSLPSSSL